MTEIGDKTGRIVHLAVLHRPHDTRICTKECLTLATAGFDVHIVTGTSPDKTTAGITFHSLELPRSSDHLKQRLTITLAGMWRALRTARRLRAQLYHLHEVSLIPVGILLRLGGARVIYDVHEDSFREKISHGENLGHPWAGRVYAVVAALLESVSKLCFQGFVAATPQIGSKFPPRRTVVVQNFPRLEEIARATDNTDVIEFQQRANLLVYLGNVFVNRGAREMVDAVAQLPNQLQARLLIAGRFVPERLQAELEQRPGWQHVEFVGWQDRAGVQRILNMARVGLLLLHPRPEYQESYPVKLFEYMAAGLPVIASDFPVWRQIIEQAECGLLVDPLKPSDVAASIRSLLEDPDRAAHLGRQGRAAVQSRYNWGVEATKLLDFYQQVL